MKNALLKTRFRLLATFGLIPSAESIEKRERQTEEEYDRLKQIEKSEELARYKELKQYLHSEAFKNKKKEINAQRYKGSEAHQKEQRFRELSKTDPIKTYLKVRDSKDLRHYQEMENSRELARFLELKNFFESPEFDEFKKSLKDQKENKKKHYKNTLANYKKLQKKYGWYYRFRDSSEYARYQDLKESDKVRRFEELARAENPKKDPDYKSLKKDPDIKVYLKIHHSKKLRNFKALQNSDPIERLDDLSEQVNSQSFKNIPEDIRKLDFKNTEEYRDYKEYKKLAGNADIKKTLKFQNSKKYQVYQQAFNSDQLQEYERLKEYLESDDFKETRKYLKRSNKFKYSKEYELLQEYEQLRKSENIKWYFDNRDASKFDFSRKWERSFFDDFQTAQLDRDKWLTTYYWGKALLNDSYVQATDQHFFTDGRNVELDEGVLRIITRKEQVDGKAWHPGFGFYPRQFEYTSGIINTGQSFRQKYGIYRTKAHLSHARNLRHSFWLVPEKILPEIDVFSYSRKNPRRLDLNAYSGEVQDKKSLKIRKSILKGFNFSKRYVIYELDWRPGVLIWKINGIPVRKQKQAVPDEPMYMILNSGVDGTLRERDLPKELRLDWVAVYRQRDQQPQS
ncbi:MAG: family 16 glycosylhydrolase [Bacteroidales bacterium]|nr:family 16 glycosylhydrolase [Bacteroidales bacterium]